MLDPEAQDHGTAVLSCQNHPTLRWVHTKWTERGPSQYMGRGVLMFEGEEGGKPSNSLVVLTERAVKERGSEFESAYREHYTPECDCPFSKLHLIGWVEEHVPASKEEADAMIQGIADRVARDSEFAV